MKRSLLITALAIGAYYLLREILGHEEQAVAPRKKHLTDAFAKAKEHAINTVME